MPDDLPNDPINPPSSTLQDEKNNQADNLCLEAQTLLSNQRLEDALARYDHALMLVPTHIHALHFRGLTHFFLARWHEALSDCDQVLALDPTHLHALNNRGLVLAKLKCFDEALTCLNQVLARQPHYPPAERERAFILVALNRLDEALAHFDDVLTREPDNVDVLSNKSSLCLRLKCFDEALALCDRAIDINPRHVDAWNNRGNILTALNRFDEALVVFDQLTTHIAPQHVHGFHNRGLLLEKQNRLTDAIAAYQQATALNPNHAIAQFAISLCLLKQGDFEHGWRAYEWRWKTPLFAPLVRTFTQPLWLGNEPLQGKTLLISIEQGLGDALQFCRYIDGLAAQGARVIFEVHPGLKELLRRLPGVHQLITVGEPLPDFDYHIPLLSLPLALGTRLETIPARAPYLPPTDPARVTAWTIRLGVKKKFSVGLVLTGNPKHQNDHNRSITWEQFMAVFFPALTPTTHLEAQHTISHEIPHEIPHEINLELQNNIEWICLQKDLRADDATCINQPNSPIQNISTHLDDFADTAALIERLDLVITVDTSTAHLAGAMGKPVWILLPYAADFRWLLDRTDSPWYPSATLYRQPQTDDWHTVLQRVKTDLHAQLASDLR